MAKLFPVLMALTAYTMLSLGFVLMKKGVHWMGWKEKKNGLYYHNLFIWTIGFLIMNIYGLPSAIALKSLSPHIVAAFAGWGIVMLVLFSFLILKEKIYPSDYFYAFLVVVGIFLLAFFEKKVGLSSAYQRINSLGLLLLCLLPLFVLLLGVVKPLSKWKKFVGLAAVSGMAAGMMVVTLRLLVMQMGYHVSLYFSSWYLYLYIFFALLSLVALQLALKSGSMIAIGPVQYAANIIYPLCATLLVFQQSIHWVQGVAVVVIVFAVVAILKKHE